MSIHVACGTGGAYSDGAFVQVQRAKLIWSELIANSGEPSTNAAPGGMNYSSMNYSRPLLLISNLEDRPVFVSIGPTPNVSVEPRHVILPKTKEAFSAEPGDKVAWAAV